MIATDVPGCREIVIPGETGLLVPYDDAAALADAIETLADVARAARAVMARRRAGSPSSASRPRPSAGRRLIFIAVSWDEAAGANRRRCGSLIDEQR